MNTRCSLKRKVYVAHLKNHDLSAAEKFGELIIVTEGEVSIFKTDDLIGIVKHKVSDITDEDYILLSGSPIINCIIVSYALSRCGRCQVLIFNAISREYVPRTLTEQQLT